MEDLYKSSYVNKFIENIENPTFANTHIKLRSRSVIVGGSGVGKTNGAVNLVIKSPNTFSHILVVNRQVEEPLYKALKDQLGPLNKITFFTLETLPDLTELAAVRNPGDEYLIIWDDVIADIAANRRYQQKLLNFFIMGRKDGLTQLLIAQDYHTIPKAVRGQLDYLMIMKLGSVDDLKLIARHHTGLNVTLAQMLQMYEIATARKFDWLRIGVQETDPNMRFRRNFTDEFFVKVKNGKATITPGPWYQPNEDSDSDNDNNYKGGKKRKQEWPWAPDGTKRGRRA